MCGYDKGTKQWRTAKLKEYPPSLCLAIASAVVDSLQKASEPTDAQAAVPEIDLWQRYASTYSQFDVYSEDASGCIQPDYAGLQPSR